MLAILPAAAFLISLAILFSLARPRRLPQATAPADAISIVIPARNEEANIARLLTTLKAQSTSPLEIIVVDDQSADRTAEVARDLGATVIPGKEMPPGWKGKTWACQQGAEAASGEWLLFLDADLTFLPDALARLAALLPRNQVQSVCPYHRVVRPYEQLSAYFNAITLAGVDAFALTPSKVATLFGQVFLIRKDHYQKAGGHEVVKNEILENYRLARLIRDQDVGIQHALGRGAIEMRMFPAGPTQLIESWKKGFLAGASQAPPRALVTISLWLTGGMILIGSLLTAPFFPPLFLKVTAAASLGYALLSFHAFRLGGNFSFLAALFFPITLLFYQALFLIALIDQKRGRKQTWKGRTLS